MIHPEMREPKSETSNLKTQTVMRIKMSKMFQKRKKKEKERKPDANAQWCISNLDRFCMHVLRILIQHFLSDQVLLTLYQLNQILRAYHSGFVCLPRLFKSRLHFSPVRHRSKRLQSKNTARRSHSIPRTEIQRILLLCTDVCRGHSEGLHKASNKE